MLMLMLPFGQVNSNLKDVRLKLKSNVQGGTVGVMVGDPGLDWREDFDLSKD